MSFPRLPRLPVSRRRHEALRQVNEYNMAVARQTEGQLRRVTEISREAIREREDIRARVAELEQAIREHRALHLQQDVGHDKNLAAVLIGHDRQGRVGLRVEKHVDVPDDVKLAPEPDDTDIRHPRSDPWRPRNGREAQQNYREARSGRFKRPFQRMVQTGGSFKGVRRER